MQVYENNWVGTIMGVKRADERRMKGVYLCVNNKHRFQLREEFGGKENVKKKLVRSRLEWPVMWKEGEMKTGKEIRCPESRRKRRRGGPRLLWEDCIKRDLDRVAEERNARAKDRRNWRLLIDNTVREK